MNFNAMDNVHRFLTAAVDNQFAVVEKLLYLPEYKDKLSTYNKSLALYLAVENHQDHKMAELLFEHDVDPSEIILNRENCVHLAARIDSAEIISLFIEIKVDMNIPDSFRGELALDKAVCTNSFNVVEILLANKARVKDCDQYGYGSIVRVALRHKFISLIKLFLEYGVDPYFKSDGEISLFEESFKLQDDEVTEFFLRCGADLNLKTSDQGNVLHLVVKNNSQRVIRRILEMNIIDVNEKDAFGCTSLHFAVLHNGDEGLAITRLLISHGALKNEVNVHGATPLIYAIEKNAIEVIKYLVNKGADLNHGIYSLLVQAALCAHGNIFRLLLNMGAKFKSEIESNLDKITSAILDIKVSFSCFKAVKILTEQGLVLKDYEEFKSNLTETEMRCTRERYDNIKVIQQQCNAMKVTRIAEELDVTYFDILTKRGHDLVQSLYQAPILAQFLFRAANPVGKFVDFSDDLQANYLRGLQLYEIQSLLQKLPNNVLPFEIILMITDYLNDDDLDCSIKRTVSDV